MPIDNKSEILRFIETQGHATSRQLCDYLCISRQALNKHIRGLIDIDKIIKSGSTRATKYYPIKGDTKPAVFKKTLRLEKLDESQVYESVMAMAIHRAGLANCYFQRPCYRSPHRNTWPLWLLIVILSLITIQVGQIK